MRRTGRNTDCYDSGSKLYKDDDVLLAWNTWQTALASRDAERCVWTTRGWSARHTYYRTECGHDALANDYGGDNTTRPCWCGRRIQINTAERGEE